MLAAFSVHRGARHGPASLEISAWLKACIDAGRPKTVEYFQQNIALFSVLVRRNAENAREAQSWLPYELLLAVVRHPEMQTDGSPDKDGKPTYNLLPTVTKFVQLIRDLWVEAVPHEPMVYVKHVRMWKNVEAAAESGKLSSRLTESKSVKAIEWDKFGATRANQRAEAGLIAAAIGFLGGVNTDGKPRTAQSASLLVVNSHILALLQLMHSLIEYGFIPYKDVHDELLPTLLALLDGRKDETDREGASRFEVHTKSTYNTKVIMECKVWLCRILQLLYTMQLDIRLSHLLLDYKGEVAPRLEPRSLAQQIDQPASTLTDTLCAPPLEQWTGCSVAELRQRLVANERKRLAGEEAAETEPNLELRTCGNDARRKRPPDERRLVFEQVTVYERAQKARGLQRGVTQSLADGVMQKLSSSSSGGATHTSLSQEALDKLFTQARATHRPAVFTLTTPHHF